MFFEIMDMGISLHFAMQFLLFLLVILPPLLYYYITGRWYAPSVYRRNSTVYYLIFGGILAPLLSIVLVDYVYRLFTLPGSIRFTFFDYRGFVIIPFVEELVRGSLLLLLFLIFRTRDVKATTLLGGVFGVMFASVENYFYFGIYTGSESGYPSFVVQRLLLTTPIHIALSAMLSGLIALIYEYIVPKREGNNSVGAVTKRLSLVAFAIIFIQHLHFLWNFHTQITPISLESVAVFVVIMIIFFAHLKKSKSLDSGERV